MFHSLFPTSNVNSPSPLVEQRFPPVFPTMSPQESRTIWCLVEGDTKPYDIFDIPIEANVNRLKAAIQQRVRLLREIDPDRLQLYKVVSLIPGACTF
jgi:Crinkler effector protein N-terminal domain